MARDSMSPLSKLGLSRHVVVGIGDGRERPLVAGVLPVWSGSSGMRLFTSSSRRLRHARRERPVVAELANQLIASNIARMEGELERHLVLVGHTSATS